MNRTQPGVTPSLAAPVAAPSTHDLAHLAYVAYGEEVGGLNYMGLPMPAWDDLSTKILDGWVAAAGAVEKALAARPGADADA